MINGGMFITLEGGEGTGKSTQVRMLVRRLEGVGRKVEATREPGATPLGKRISDLVRSTAGTGPVDKAELMLYLADRAQHVERVIAPALAKGMAVVCDRFVDSSEVYQGLGRELGASEVRRLNQWVCGDVWPDLTVVLDLDPETGLRRAMERQDSLGLGLDRLEKEAIDFHRQVRRGFLSQAEAEPERVKVVDAGLPQDQVAERIWEQVERLLKERRP
jgi:dTMP kinase